MKLTIEQADNGYVLSYQDTFEDSDKEYTRYIVVEDKDGDNTNLETKTTQALLQAITNHFCIFGSKHDAERVFIIRRDQNGKEIED